MCDRSAITVLSAASLTATVIAGQDPCAPQVELWVGGWNSHNVVRIDWRDGALIQTVVSPFEGSANQPHDYSFGPDGNLYIASHGNSTVLRFTPTGAFIDVFIPAANGLNRSHSVFWKDDDTLLVASELTDRVIQYDAGGGFIGNYVGPGEGGLVGPELIIEGPDGMLYLTGQSNQVLRLDPDDGGVLDVFVGDDPLTPRDETGGLSWAHGLDFGPDGNLYVASSQNSRVLRYDGTTGAFLDVVTSGGVLSFPIGLAFGPDDNLYVASFNNHRIFRYDAGGNYLGVAANLSGMSVSGPLGIRFLPAIPDPDCNGNFIADACDVLLDGDINGNGVPDDCETIGDIDGDGVVNVDDLTAVILAWGPCNCPADVNGDGGVDVDDLVLVVLNWT